MKKMPTDIWRVAVGLVEDIERDDWEDGAVKDIARAILAERQRCANAVLAEKLIDPTDHPDDAAYDTAIDHAHEAIWRVEP